MLNQLLLTAQCWLGQTPLAAIRGSLESASRFLSALKSFAPWSSAR